MVSSADDVEGGGFRVSSDVHAQGRSFRGDRSRANGAAVEVEQGYPGFRKESEAETFGEGGLHEDACGAAVDESRG